MHSATRGVVGASTLLLLAALAGDLYAQAYPAKLIRVIIPRSPGGGSDIIARLISPGMQKKLGQTFLVENHPDAAAVVGAELTARAQPDGYTIFLADNAFYQNPAILKKLPYDTLKDFSGVTMLAQSPVILVVGGPVQAKDVKSLIQYAKANPGKLTYGSGGIGASTHLAGVLFNRAAGVDIIHVPFKSSGQALESLLGNHLTMQFGGISSARCANRRRQNPRDRRHRQKTRSLGAERADVRGIRPHGGGHHEHLGHPCARRNAARGAPRFARCPGRSDAHA